MGVQSYTAAMFGLFYSNNNTDNSTTDNDDEYASISTTSANSSKTNTPRLHSISSLSPHSFHTSLGNYSYYSSHHSPPTYHHHENDLIAAENEILLAIENYISQKQETKLKREKSQFLSELYLNLFCGVSHCLIGLSFTILQHQRQVHYHNHLDLLSSAFLEKNQDYFSSLPTSLLKLSSLHVKFLEKSSRQTTNNTTSVSFVNNLKLLCLYSSVHPIRLLGELLSLMALKYPLQVINRIFTSLKNNYYYYDHSQKKYNNNNKKDNENRTETLHERQRRNRRYRRTIALNSHSDNHDASNFVTIGQPTRIFSPNTHPIPENHEDDSSHSLENWRIVEFSDASSGSDTHLHEELLEKSTENHKPSTRLSSSIDSSTALFLLSKFFSYFVSYPFYGNFLFTSVFTRHILSSTSSSLHTSSNLVVSPSLSIIHWQGVLSFITYKTLFVSLDHSIQKLLPYIFRKMKKKKLSWSNLLSTLFPYLFPKKISRASIYNSKLKRSYTIKRKSKPIDSFANSDDDDELVDNHLIDSSSSRLLLNIQSNNAIITSTSKHRHKSLLKKQQEEREKRKEIKEFQKTYHDVMVIYYSSFFTQLFLYPIETFMLNTILDKQFFKRWMNNVAVVMSGGRHLMLSSNPIVTDTILYNERNVKLVWTHCIQPLYLGLDLVYKKLIWNWLVLEGVWRCFISIILHR